MTSHSRTPYSSGFHPRPSVTQTFPATHQMVRSNIRGHSTICYTNKTTFECFCWDEQSEIIRAIYLGAVLHGKSPLYWKAPVSLLLERNLTFSRGGGFGLINITRRLRLYCAKRKIISSPRSRKSHVDSSYCLCLLSLINSYKFTWSNIEDI